jgi:hypothetical protein
MTLAFRAAGRAPGTAAVAAVGALAIGCVETVHVDSRFADGPSPRSIAVLGVYENGRMVSLAEDGAFTAWGGAPNGCTAAYGPALFAGQPGLSAAIDEYTQVHGPSTELLERLAPAARADAILVVVLTRQPSEVHVDVKGNPDRDLTMAGASIAAGLAGGSPPGGSGHSSISVRRDPSVEGEALLFSVAQRRWVGSIAVRYAGEHPGKALARFSDEIAEQLHGARCAAWDWRTPIDVAAINRAATANGS